MTGQNVAAIILAAGGSSRLGQPKQLLRIDGQSFVRRTAIAAIDAGCGPIVVVLGAAAPDVAPELDGLPVRVVINDGWAGGMGTSLRAGAAAALVANPSLVGAVVLLCDQPRITAAVVERLVTAWQQGGKPMAACAYDIATFGPPCCFSRNVFDRFATLSDESGAKALLRADPSAVELVPWPDGRIDIDTPEQLIQLGKAHHQAGRLVEAQAIYHQVLLWSPDHADALSLLGVAAIQSGRLEKAAEFLRRAVELAPDVARYQCNLGECLRLMGNLDAAIQTLRAATSLKPDLAVAHNNLGIALAEKGLLADAMVAYRAAIEIQPNYGEAHSNLGNAHRARREIDEAVGACRQAVELNPNRAESWNSLGAALADKGETVEACNAFRRAMELKPDYPESHTNLGNALAAEGRLEEAAIAFRRAVELSANSVPAHWNLAVALLRQGDYENGWPEHEWRLKAKSQFPVRPFAQPQWRGEDLNGRTILLHAEQGFGDTIQFVRYVPMVASRGGRVILECQPELSRLLQGLRGVDQLIARGDPLPAFDLQCPLLSLPLAFNTDLHSIPCEIPYLKVDSETVQVWASKTLRDPAKLNVGLCWAGRPTHSNDESRSIEPSNLSVLASEATIFYSLKPYDPGQAGDEMPRKLAWRDYGDQLTDFVDTASLILNLDLVISVDTAVAHLAGALGKPVWLLLPFTADWRWLVNRDDSPWYPTIRLFRQRRPGDWDKVLLRVTNELSRLSMTAVPPSAVKG
jgi:CTP:molybdopterin cytidylyltransferase MocA/Tfp pilus assembly protein PilF